MGINLQEEDLLASCRRNPAKRAILLYSGGLDSTLLLHEKTPSLALFLRYGQRHLKEFWKAKENCDSLGIPLIERSVELTGGVASDGDAFICPVRNLVFLGIAANVAVQQSCDEILIGCNKTDKELFPDCRLGFLEFVRHAIKGSGYELRVEGPLLNSSKEEIGRRAVKLGITSEQVWSCYAGGDEPCGECVACKESPFMSNDQDK